mgnify:CR=1 FL=1
MGRISLNNIWKLIYNELFKLYIRKSTWVMYIVLAVLVIGNGMLTKAFDETDQTYDKDSWRDVLHAENETILKEYADYERKMLENQDGFFIPPDITAVERNQYYLDHDIMPESYGAWKFVYDNLMMLSLVSLFTIIIASGILAREFNLGTIKLLLIRPISRSTILLSKYIAVIIFSILTSLFTFITAWFTGAILFGVEGLYPSGLFYLDPLNFSSGFKFVPIIPEILSGFAYQLINLIMMATFALMISSMFRNSSLAIGLAIFLMFTGNTIVQFFSDKPWAKYILFANTNLEQYKEGHNPLIEGMTLPFSITILIVYYIVFIVLTWLFFTKRDVAGN